MTGSKFIIEYQEKLEDPKTWLIIVFIVIILVNKNYIYSTYSMFIFIFQTSFQRTLAPVSSLHH